VEVLTPPDGVYCDGDGAYLGKRTILAMCVCDPDADVKILGFKPQTVYESFVSPSAGSGGAGEMICGLFGNAVTVLVIDCPGVSLTAPETTELIHGEQLIVASAMDCVGGCETWALTEVCVMAVGDTETGGCECEDCPDPPDPCPTGSGSG
jgi:hypothetical protein